jgi:16S rRNA (guanine527-N7)-methyltransferase
VDSRKLLAESLREMNIRASLGQIDKLVEFNELVYENNKYTNLIGRTEKENIIKRHILDSASLLSNSDILFRDVDKDNFKMIDIGTGGGFPGIPLAILLNGSKVFLLEKSKKKVEFLLFAIDKLSLTNVSILNGRAEEIARLEGYRENFEIVTARAVTKFNILLELSIPFCSINGRIIFYKSSKVIRDIEAGYDAIKMLGGTIDRLIDVNVEGLEEYRALLVLKKVRKTPERYPRIFAQIKKYPLKLKYK